MALALTALIKRQLRHLLLTSKAASAPKLNFMKHLARKLLAGALLLGLGACSQPQPPATAPASLTRIVSVSKQLTEMLFALGAGGHVVGVDLSSNYPAAADHLPKVGYHRLLNAEGIIALKPTVVFHDGNVAPAAVLTQLQKVGIPLREFAPTTTIAATCQLQRQLGQLFGQVPRADSLCASLEADMRVAAARRASYQQAPKVLILHYGRQKNIYLVMGQQSTATQLLAWAGGTNALAAPEGMKPLSPELLATTQPDIILATDYGYDRLGGLEGLRKLPGLAFTPAVQHGRVYRVEEHDLVYLGPRSGQVVLALQKLLHQ